MTVVMTGIRTSHLLTKREGMGSSGQDFNAKFWISDLTFLTDKVLNADNVGNTLAVLSTEIDASWTVKSVISASWASWASFSKPFDFLFCFFFFQVSVPFQIVL